MRPSQAREGQTAQTSMVSFPEQKPLPSGKPKEWMDSERSSEMSGKEAAGHGDPGLESQLHWECAA